MPENWARDGLFMDDWHDVSKDEMYREARLNYARWWEAETERQIWEQQYELLCKELLSMPLQSKRVSDAVAMSKARLAAIWRGRQGSDAT